MSKWFRRTGRKSLKSLTSNSTGHRLAFLKFCGSLKRHDSSINPNTLPVSCSAVKARQARKKCGSWGAGYFASQRIPIRSLLPSRFVVCFFLVFPKLAWRRELFQNWFPVIVAGLVLANLSPRVPGVVIFQKGGHLWVCGSGSSL